MLSDLAPLLLLVGGCILLLLAVHFLTLWQASRRKRASEAKASPAVRHPRRSSPPERFPFDGTFAYHASPHQFSTFTRESKTCLCCSEARPAHQVKMTGDEDADWICEQCLGEGMLATYVDDPSEPFIECLSPSQHESTSVDDVWDRIYPQIRTSADDGWNDPAVYAFHCGNCGRYEFQWDAS